jgi:AraC-like DNA-binding protein
MPIQFARCGFEGEVSSAPDRLIGLSDELYLDGIGFIEYDYFGPGTATQRIAGLLVGACECDPDGAFSFSFATNAKCVRDTLVVRGPGQDATGSWSGGHRGRLLSVAPHVLERIFRKPLSQIHIEPTFCDLREKIHVLHLLTSLADEYSGKRPIDPLFVESVVFAVLRASGIRPPTKAQKSARLSVVQIDILRDLIASNLTSLLTLREMASAVDLSESYFVRAFKGSFGETPYRYVLRERVALAQDLMQNSDLSLSEIASPAGFADANRMGRTFRQITGLSPTGVSRTRRRTKLR